MRGLVLARVLNVAGVAIALGLATLAWRLGPPPSPAGETPAPPVTPASANTHALREEAIALYAAQQFAGACERFSRAADHDPAREAWRQDVARCFDGWGRQVLRDGRPAEALLLFRQGLRLLPDDPALLKGLGIAAIHAGQPAEALEPLERAIDVETDADVRLLLARLYDQRDRADRALDHLRALLEREPAHEAGRRLLEKIERERDAETGFLRAVTDHFVLKHRGLRRPEPLRTVLRALEVAWQRVGTELEYRPAERLTVVLYDDVRFHDVTRAHGWVTGLYDGKIRLPLGATLPPWAALERLVVHEYAHAAIHELSRGRAPRWLHEGLAQHLEGATADPLLRVPGSLTLGGLEALVSDPDPVRARDGYEIALWVTEDLLARGGRRAMRTLLDRLGAGDTLAAGLARVYGLRLAELESQWQHLLGG